MYISTIAAAAEWSSFFGHFHPVVVHLPIGMLVIAFMLEVLAIKQHTTQWNKAIAFILLWGCISAIASALLGWLLSLSGGYNEHTLFLHQWAGISLAVIAGFSWYLKTRSGISKKPNTLYRITLCTMILLLTITGHLGGSITHGDGYLTDDMPEPLRGWLGLKATAPAVRKKITNLNEALVYQDIVSPVLQTKCWSCHSEAKSKGDLRMDTQTLLMKGGKDGPVIVKNNAAGSELMKRLLLPPDDEHRMPPKGKEALTNDEIALIKWWINSGTDFTKKVKDIKTDDATRQLLARITGGAPPKSEIAGTTSNHSTQSTFFNKKVAPAADADVNALKKLSVLVSPIAQGQNYLSVSCIDAPDFGDAQTKLLTKLAPQITWLQLNNTKITNVGLIEIAKLTNLTRLDLANTIIDNSGLKGISGLFNLEYLNLTGTKTDDQGLMRLVTLRHLKQVYCWNTKITAQGANVMRNSNIKADLGY